MTIGSQIRVETIRSPIHAGYMDTREVVNDLQSHLALYGYQLVEMPIIDRSDLFLTKAGDQVAERLFTFERHGHNLALRPEFTAAAAYRYIQHYPNQQAIARWQFGGPIFEDDPKQSGTNYQRYSVGVELLGMAGPPADSEVIAVAAKGIIKQQPHDWKLVIGHVGLTRRLLERHMLDDRTQRFILHRRDLLSQADGHETLRRQLSSYLPAVHNLDSLSNGDNLDETDTHQLLDVLLDASQYGETMGGRTRHEIARRLLAKRKQAAQRNQIDAALEFLRNWINISAAPTSSMPEMERFIGADPIAWTMLAEWQNTLTFLEQYGIPPDHIILQPDLARTWDYYTGLVFELQVNDIPVASGGRYDELTRLIGGSRDVPAVGFAYYLDRLVQALPQAATHPTKLITLVTANNTYSAAIQWANVLREQSFHTAIVNRLPTDAEILVHVNGDGSVRLGQHFYTAQQVDFLVMELKQRIHA